MNNNVTIKHLARWIGSLKEIAKGDCDILVSWFKDTQDKPISIVGGWMKGFSEKYSDLLCMSRTNPEQAMCVKIVLNEGAHTGVDFENLKVPHGDEAEENICIALELEDNSESLATFLVCEWERLMKEHGL